MIARQFFTCGLALYTALAGAASSRDARMLDERVRDALDERLRQYNIHGASVAVVLPGDTVHCVCAGVSHDSVAMGTQMLFAIGSITRNLISLGGKGSDILTRITCCSQ